MKKKLVEYKGGKCEKCGYDKCLEALTFHHRNPKDKSFVISGKHSKKPAILFNEVDKCDLLCHNCHNEVHAQDHVEKWKRWDNYVANKPPKIKKEVIGAK